MVNINFYWHFCWKSIDLTLSTEFAIKEIFIVMCHQFQRSRSYHLFYMYPQQYPRPAKRMRFTEGWVRLWRILRFCRRGDSMSVAPIYDLVSMLREVTSVKFHYRSPAINIINWATRLTGPRFFFFLFLVHSHSLIQSPVPSHRHPPWGSSSEYIPVRFPYPVAFPTSFLNPPR